LKRVGRLCIGSFILLTLLLDASMYVWIVNFFIFLFWQLQQDMKFFFFLLSLYRPSDHQCPKCIKWLDLLRPRVLLILLFFFFFLLWNNLVWSLQANKGILSNKMWRFPSACRLTPCSNRWFTGMASSADEPKPSPDLSCLFSAGAGYWGTVTSGVRHCDLQGTSWHLRVIKSILSLTFDDTGFYYSS
jgi:hypothetical protein